MLPRSWVPETASQAALDRWFWVIAVLLALGMETVAACAGGDATWDLRNYHLYNPFALLHKPVGTDIAPAHMQTFLPPTLDLLYYSLARSIPSTLLLNAVLAVPQAFAACLAWLLSWRLVRPQNGVEAAALGLMTALAATGVAALSTIATSSSEILPGALVLAAWAILIQPELDRLPSAGRLFVAGLLVGAACGLKLTLSFASVAFLCVLLLIPRRRALDLVSRPVLFGCGLAAGALALTGYWWAHEWTLYGNPFFPMMNQIFRSPKAVPESFVDPTFLPRTWLQALQAPWVWALRLSWATSESRLRDPRFSLAMIAAAFCLVRLGWSAPRWRPWPWLVLPAWFVLGFVLWRFEFSIIRYLSVLELLVGAMLAMAAFPLARRFRQPGLLLAGSAALLGCCAYLTVYPQVNRTAPGNTAPFAVDLGRLPPNSMVLLLDNEPLGYFAAFADPRIRFIGTNDFFMSLDSSNPMQPDVERAIASHTGPLFGLDSPATQGARADATLARYGLSRSACRPVVSNLSPEPIRLCELKRAS
ncbi:MAG: hypothetical protein RQ966_15905 [Acetobacteraceae bacterium]|nr:hypothetical protein [Acetobacteraceae bacterium]